MGGKTEDDVHGGSRTKVPLRRVATDTPPKFPAIRGVVEFRIFDSVDSPPRQTVQSDKLAEDAAIRRRSLWKIRNE